MYRATTIALLLLTSTLLAQNTSSPSPASDLAPLFANIWRITRLLTTEFLGLVGIAFLFAAPLAWYTMHKWLQDFAYQITIGWWIFALAGLGAIAIALLTVSFQAIRAAMANPVRSLRSE